MGRAPKSNKTQNLVFPTKSIKRKNVNRKKIQKLIFRALVLHHSQSRDCGLCATSFLRPSPPPEDEQDRALGTRMDCVRFYLSNNGTILQVETYFCWKARSIYWQAGAQALNLGELRLFITHSLWNHSLILYLIKCKKISKKIQLMSWNKRAF